MDQMVDLKTTVEVEEARLRRTATDCVEQLKRDVEWAIERLHKAAAVRAEEAVEPSWLFNHAHHILVRDLKFGGRGVLRVEGYFEGSPWADSVDLSLPKGPVRIITFVLPSKA